MGALTQDGSICSISSFYRNGPYTDWVFEVPASPMIEPRMLVDTEGNHWPIDAV